MKLTGKKM